jgi:homoserine dehydrogenase
MMYEKTIGIGILGFGVIASQVACVLRDKAHILAERAGCCMVVKKIKVLPSDLENPKSKGFDTSLFTTEDEEFFTTQGIDIVIEAIGGENPAFEYITKAMSYGKHIVTSNKEVVAKHAAELLPLALTNGVSLRLEASVGGGIPLISSFQYDLIANEITGIFAIINGTTNYILSQMANEGLDFEYALAEAQKLGYAEADPTNDIEGSDAVYKLAILASIAFGIKVRPEDIYREGISNLESRDFRYAREFGYSIKLLAIAKANDTELEVRVHPVLIPEESFLAKVDGVYNAVLAEGDLIGDVVFLGEGAGPKATSSAVIADVVSAAKDITLGVGNRLQWKINSGKSIKPMSEIETRYYFRMSIADKPDVLSQVAHIFGLNDISISAAIQKEADKESRTAEIVIMTHPAREDAVQRAVKKFVTIEAVRRVNNVIRVEI